MGAGIAEICAKAGAQVVVVEADPRSLADGRSRIESSLERSVKSNKLTAKQRSEVMSRLCFTVNFNDLHDRTFVVEAIAENEVAKADVFRRLDAVITDPQAVLATNTSSIPIIKLAIATRRPDKVIGIHFFNPVPVLKLVELIPSLLTSEETIGRARTFVVDDLEKVAIHAPDRAGFIVNALLIPYLLSAIRMLESGVASATDIDAGMVLGCAHPIGPLALVDLIGLDTTRAVAEMLYEEFKEPHMAPPPLLLRMTQAGLNGRKSGRGFFDYPSQ